VVEFVEEQQRNEYHQQVPLNNSGTVDVVAADTSRLLSWNPGMLASPISDVPGAIARFIHEAQCTQLFPSPINKVLAYPPLSVVLIANHLSPTHECV